MGRILEVRGDITEIFHHDEASGKSTIQITQDVEPYLEANKQKLSESSTNWKGEMHHVARIPMVIIEQWNAELGANCLKKEYRPWFMAKLNDIKYSKLRVKAGKL